MNECEKISLIIVALKECAKRKPELSKELRIANNIISLSCVCFAFMRCVIIRELFSKGRIPCCTFIGKWKCMLSYF